MPDDSAQRSALKTIVSLLRVGLGGRHLYEPAPELSEALTAPDEDVVLDAYADRLAVMIDWLPRESAWEGALSMNLALLDLLDARVDEDDAPPEGVD